MSNYKEIFMRTVELLSNREENSVMAHFAKNDIPMPSRESLVEIMELLRAVFFPGYYGESDITSANIKYYTGAKLDKALFLLTEQIKRGFCFSCNASKNKECSLCEIKAKEIAYKFLETVPEIRRMLSKDVVAAYSGDPAAESYGETIFCYPGIRALTNYRTAHELHKLGVPILPRIITEIAHSETGIDIHPEAQIGSEFFMDHGTGIVIGGTSIIGNNVKIYQGVTLGAKSFPLDEHGNPIKGIPRHPVIEDSVVIYAGATILGRIVIGKSSVIGGNTWITESVEPNSKIFYK